MEYNEMMFLANMRRKAKVEFENNLWKRRFEELNGFPMEERQAEQAKRLKELEEKMRKEHGDNPPVYAYPFVVPDTQNS